MPQIHLRNGTPAALPATLNAGTTAPRPAYQKFAVDVRSSVIDGQGAFAAEAIPPRLKIGEIRGESLSVAQARIRATLRAHPRRLVRTRRHPHLCDGRAPQEGLEAAAAG